MGDNLPLGMHLLITDAELGPAGHQHLGHILHQREEQLQLHGRVTSGEFLQQGAEPGEVGVIIDGQGEARLHPGRQLPGNGLQPFTLRQQDPRLLHHAGPRVRQLRIAAAAVKQGERQIDLQIGDGAAHHRLRLAQLAGGSGKRAGFGGRQQDPQLFQ